MVEFINKLMVLIYVLSILNGIRHAYKFLQAWFESSKGNPIRLEITNKDMFLLGLSLSYIITGIITGVTF